MRAIGKDRRGCDTCNPLDEIIMRLEELERRATAIVSKVQGIAPDATGDVTLPTSSSVDGPLYGNIGVFAMSSEVREAADDVHQYASAIADDVIEIRSDLEMLTDRVNELEPAGFEQLTNAVQSLQNAVQSLQNSVQTLETGKQNTIIGGASTITDNDLTADRALISNGNGKVSVSEVTPTELGYLDGVTSPIQSQINAEATARNNADTALQASINGKVSKSGDTMTGNLGFDVSSVTPIIIKNLEMDVNETGGPETQMIFNDKNGTLMGRMGVSNYGFKSIGFSSYWSDTWFELGLRKNADGTVCGIAPSWSPGVNDNSNKILTILMANSLPSLIHSTGNETKSGTLTLTDSPHLKAGGERGYLIDRTDKVIGDSWGRYRWDRVFDNNNNYVGQLLLWNNETETVHELIANNLNNGNVVTGSLTVGARSDGATYATAPTTPSNATTNEIATANWVISKINQAMTQNGLTGI